MKINKVKVVEKPWGRELWYAVEKEYAGKVLEMKKGYRSSMHYHVKKKETMYLMEGEVKIERDNQESIILQEGDCITIDPGEAHRIIPLTDSKILESSTPELEDVVRVKDDYNR